MGRYINKEGLLRQLKEKEQDSCMEYNAVLGIMIAEGIVNELPVEDAALVVHAKWITSYMNGTKYACYCSNCGFGKGLEYDYYKESHEVYDFCYCPHCGAKMDLVEDEDHAD